MEDVNDNTPIFKPYQPSINIPEDAPQGIVSVLHATDADEGAYGQVVYHLQEVDAKDPLFTISTVGGKGVIRLTGIHNLRKIKLLTDNFLNFVFV